jgi:hypothetical protein
LNGVHDVTRRASWEILTLALLFADGCSELGGCCIGRDCSPASTKLAAAIAPGNVNDMVPEPANMEELSVTRFSWSRAQHVVRSNAKMTLAVMSAALSRRTPSRTL